MADDTNYIPQGIQGVADEQPTTAEGRAKFKLNTALNKMYEEGKAVKDQKTTIFADAPGIYRGGAQWPEKRPGFRESPVINMVQQLVERKTALLTEARPKLQVVSTYAKASGALRQAFQDTATALEKVVDGIWYETAMQTRLAEAMTLAQIFGVVALNTTFNKNLGNRGLPETFVVDPRCIIVDPIAHSAHDINRCEYIIYEELWPTSRLKDEHPRFADSFKPDFGPGQAEDSGKPGLFKNMIRKMFNLDKGGVPIGVDRTYVREFWIKDRTRGTDKMPLFPGGRHLIRANNVIFEDEPNPYWDNKCPFDLMTWHFDPDTIWSFGDIELYKSPQLMLNKIVAAIIENALLINNAMWVGDFNALDPKGWDNLTNAAGLHVKKRPGTSLDRVAPAELGTTSFNVMNMLMGGLDNLSGIAEALKGQAPGSIQSGVGVESLQTAGQTNIRLMARKLEDTLNSVGNKLISRIFQYMPEDRIFHISGDGGLMSAYHFERRRLQGDPKNAFNDYKFMVIPGSSLALTKAQKGMLAFQFFTAGIVTGKEVLDAFEYPNRDRVLAEKSAQDQAMFQQQLALAQAAGDAKAQGAGQGKGGGGNRKPGYIPKPDPPPPQITAGSPAKTDNLNT